MNEAEFKSALDARKKRIAALESGEARPLLRPKAYVMDFSWPDPGYVAPVPPNTSQRVALPEQVKTAQVAAGTLFLCDEMESAYEIKGSISGNAAAFAVNPRQYMRSQITFVQLAGEVFEFDWQAHDTSNDREWTNTWLPGRVFMSGDKNGFEFDEGRGILQSGSELSVAVRAWRSFPFPDLEIPIDPSTVTEHRLQLTFRGWEVVE
jgi:hypothetical protein